jgi:hypothetical protein
VKSKFTEKFSPPTSDNYPLSSYGLEEVYFTWLGKVISNFGFKILFAFDLSPTLFGILTSAPQPSKLIVEVEEWDP